jgi:hypothetical protein
VQRLIERTSLFVLISVAILRPLIAESYDSAGSPFTEALGTVQDPSPLRTLVFDLLIIGGFAGWLLARAIGSPRRYRRTGLEWGAVLVAIAAVVSCIVAGNKRLAINASIDWLCYPLLAIALVQLLQRPWHRRLLMAGVLASACVQAFQCVEQNLTSFDETWEHYQSIKSEFWAKQGVDLDSARVESFERRIQAREATGFLPHSNVAGSYLVLCGLAATGLAVAGWRRSNDRRGVRRDAGRHGPRLRGHASQTSPTRGDATGSPRRPGGMVHARVAMEKVAPAVGSAFILTAAMLTKSLGALVAGVAAIMLWLIVAVFRRWVAAHRRSVFIIGWVVAGGGILAVVGHGLYHDSLPGWSLTFRWQYWKASSELIADHALTGVGRENFGRHYLRYKSIQSPEEVANPHNLFVQAAADWGVLGLVGIIMMVVGASRVLLFSPDAASSRVAPLKRGPGEEATPVLYVWGAALALVVILARLPLLGTDDPNFLYYASVTSGLVWLLGFALFTFGWREVVSKGDKGASLPSTGVAIGLFAFVLHDMINFATFVPGTATTLFALLAFAIGERSADEPVPPPARRAIRRWLPVGVVTLAAVVVVYVGLLPVARSAHFLSMARSAGRQLLPVRAGAQIANDHFERAAATDPLDPTPCVERARWLMAVSTVPGLRDDALPPAADSLEQAVQRDPYSIRLRRIQRRLYTSIAEATGNADDYFTAVEAARRVLDLYPLSPKDLAALAELQLQAGEATNTRELLQNAVANYRRALELDEERLSWEELHRLREKERQAITNGMHRAQRLLQQQP